MGSNITSTTVFIPSLKIYFELFVFQHEVQDIQQKVQGASFDTEYATKYVNKRKIHL